VEITEKERLRAAISDHCIAIEKMFKPGVKVSVFVRNPNALNADVLVTSDEDAALLVALGRLCMEIGQ
jgi:hypothetical protein